ncbi:MAG: peptide ABC transporter substrate-binding protein [Alphaproteobacteria bacterium]|nr:peptide ABC transporter substrate-binding protein [Alphaproteobacteria bacterium]
MAMRFPTLTRLALILGTALGLGLAGCDDKTQSRDTLVIGMTQYPATLNPNIESMLAKTYVLAMTRRPFTHHDPGWQLICALCETLPTLENGLAVPESLPNGKKGIAVTYTIKQGAKWGDGTPVTTKDVEFTYEVGKHPASGVADGELYRRILKIDVKDARTFTLHLDRLTFDYNSINTFQVLPAHIERANFKDPKEYRQRTAYDTDTTNPGLYFGPYRITKKETGSRIILEPNPTWWGKKPYFKKIVVQIIEKTAALEANLLSGSIGYIAGELGLLVDQGLAFEKRHGKNFDIEFKPSLVYEHIDLNLENPFLKDRRVRRALILALDRDELSKKLFEGRQPVADSFVHPLDWVHSKDTPRYAFDPKKAADLLDAAGWAKRDGEGFRVNGDGKRLTFELMTTAGSRTRELVQQILQSQWRKAGIDIRIRNEPARVYFGETVTKRKFKAMAMFAWLSAPESVPRLTLHSDQITTAANNWSGQNYTSYKNPEVDKLLDAIEVELDRDKRARLWARLQKIYAEDLPVLPLYFRADPFIIPKWLKGIKPTGHQDPTTLWVEHWHAATP